MTDGLDCPSSSFHRPSVSWIDEADDSGRHPRPKGCQMWRFAALRSGRVYWSTRQLICDGLMFFDAVATIDDVQVCPAIVRWWHANAVHEFRPQFLISRGLRRDFWHAFGDARLPNSALMTSLGEQLAWLGFGWVAKSRSEWPTRDALSWAELLRSHSRTPVDGATRSDICQRCRVEGGFAWADIAVGARADAPKPIVCRLIWDGDLARQPNDRIRPTTRIVCADVPAI